MPTHLLALVPSMALTLAAGALRTDGLSPRQLHAWNKIVEIVMAEDRDGRPLHPTLRELWDAVDTSSHVVHVEIPHERGPLSCIAGRFAITKVDPEGKAHEGTLTLNLRVVDQVSTAPVAARARGFIPFKGLGKNERYAELLGHELAHAVWHLATTERARLAQRLQSDLETLGALEGGRHRRGAPGARAGARPGGGRARRGGGARRSGRSCRHAGGGCTRAVAGGRPERQNAGAARRPGPETPTEDQMARHSLQAFTTRTVARGSVALALAVLALAAAAGLAPGKHARVAADDRPAYLDAARPVDERVEDLLVRLTLEEKVGLVHANGKFRAGGVERLGVPYLWTADGPQGVREELGVDSWEPAGWTSDFATAMPVGVALASTWDPELAEAYGRTVGDEARARGKHVILGPALNIQRTPLCGRNYDYFGEDPWLAGRITVGYVKGMQAEQTIACLKHYAANNQEQDRGSIDVQVDERPLREIYLPAFEAGVREGGALAVMGAYNKVRGEHICHNEYLLNQVLKREWGFKGGVISDWGGTHDTREAVLKGLDLEMGTGRPYDQYFLAGPFLAGLKDGTFPVSVLDDKVRRNLRMLIAVGRARRPPAGYDQHEGAPRRGAARRAGRDRPPEERAGRPAARPREAEDDRGDRRQRRAPLRRGRQRGRREGLPRDDRARRDRRARGRPGRRRLLAGLPPARASARRASATWPASARAS